MGGDEIIGADRIRHAGIVLTDVIGGSHPVGIQHRVFRDFDHGAGQVVVTGLDVDPACQLVVVLRGALPLAGKLRFHTGIDRVPGIIRAAAGHDIAVCAVQPQVQSRRRLAKVHGRAVILGIGHGVSRAGQLHIGILSCATQAHTAAIGIDGRFPSVRVQRTEGVCVTVGMQIISGGCILDVVCRLVIVVVGFFKNPVEGVLIRNIRIDGSGGVDLDRHRITVAVQGIGHTVGAGGVNDEAATLGQQVAGIVDGAADGRGGGRGRGGKHHHPVFGRADTKANHHTAIDGIADLRHRIVNIALDQGQDAIFQGHHNGGGLSRSVAVFVQEGHITGDRRIAFNAAIQFPVFPALAHNVRAGIDQLLGEAGISQAEGREHIGPVAVRVAVPLTVAGDAAFGHTVFVQSKVAFAFRVTQL